MQEQSSERSKKAASGAGAISGACVSSLFERLPGGVAATGNGAMHSAELRVQGRCLAREEKRVVQRFGEPALRRQTADGDVTVGPARKRVGTPIVMEDGLELLAQVAL